MSWRTLKCGAYFGLLLAGPGTAQPFFTEVTDQAFEGKPFMARSTAFGDYDNDGWPDLFLTQNYNPLAQVALWHNEGEDRFADHTMSIQGELTPEWKGGGAIFGDYDNDGDLDIFVPVGKYASEHVGQNILLRNDRGAFRDVALEAGLTDVLPTDNAIWLDFDRDGFLDLYTGNLACGSLAGGVTDPSVRNKLYRNQSNGAFADVTTAVGLDIQLAECGGSNGGMAAGDFDGDGWPDLYVGVLGNRNRLFLNDTKGGFRDATTGEIGDPGNAFGVAVGDIDNDGDLEIFQAAGGFGGLQRSLMLLNLGQGQFLDVTDGVGLGLLALEQGEVDGAALGDIDNDGDIDLLIAYPSFLFINDGNGIFTDQTAQSGISDIGLSLSLGDYDLDGFLDVVLSGLEQTLAWKLYRNNGNDNHWLRVELVGTRSNRSGIGARLIATSGELRQTREVLGGLGYYQDEMVAHFGLGQRTRVDRLEVRWPSGQVDVLTDIPADQKIRIFEGRKGYYLVHPAIAKWDAPDTVVLGAEFKVDAAVRPALFEAGAQITQITADLSAFGGPAALPLADRGEGVYSLDPVSLRATGERGFREVAVLVEQASSLGPHWSRLSKGVLVAPNEDLVIFGDEVGAGWLVQPIAGSAKLDLQEREIVYQGQGAMRVEADAFTVDFLPAAPVDLVGYQALRLAFHPGDAVAGFRGAFNVAVTTEGFDPFISGSTTVTLYVKLLYGSQEGLRLNMDQKEWQVVEIPLEAFGAIGRIVDLRLLGSLKGRFYLDDIRLVAATPPPVTVVEEERTAALPQSFFLSQNFPNPFNSSTVIRFALPEGSEVELAVYNLTGQRVATLAEGVREAGSYTLRWDGRDEQGDELASGVYLYWLRAGVKAEMKKLVLVR